MQAFLFCKSVLLLIWELLQIFDSFQQMSFHKFLFQFVWIVAFLATVLLDVDLGLLVAVIFGIITIVARSQR